MEWPHRVIADKKKSRLYIELQLTESEQAEKIEDEIWTKAKQLVAGWGCIVNYTEIDVPLAEDLLDKAEAIMSFLKQLGMGQLIRVPTEKQYSLNDELKIRSMKIVGYEGILAKTAKDANITLVCIPTI